jgi:hypothetical protein
LNYKILIRKRKTGSLHKIDRGWTEEKDSDLRKTDQEEEKTSGFRKIDQRKRNKLVDCKILISGRVSELRKTVEKKENESYEAHI